MTDLLESLRRRESQQSGDPKSGRARRLFSISLFSKSLPWLLLAAFLLLLWVLVGDRFERGRALEVAQVLAIRAQDSGGERRPAAQDAGSPNFEGATVFQASGWFEPDPLPIRATTLYSGVVQAVHVLDGERVEKGQLIAEMVREDAELDLQEAQARLKTAQATLRTAESNVESRKAAIESLERDVAASKSHFDELKDRSDRLEKAGREVFREGDIIQARLKTEEQKNRMLSLEARRPELAAQLQGALAAVEGARASVETAEVARARAELALARTFISSPIDGRIQNLYAAPGMKRMLDMDDPNSATIATLFDPDSLQARIDVPLEEAARLRIGQPVRLRSSLLPDALFKGLVTRIEGEADIQRNTLQAKVRILNPGDLLRPEMLCRAEFLALDQPTGGSEQQAGTASRRVAIYVPETAVVDFEAGPGVWALDASRKRIERRIIQPGSEIREGHVRVLGGLRPGDLVVREPAADLEAGERVKYTAD